MQRKNNKKNNSVVISSNQLIKNVEPLLAKTIKDRLDLQVILIPKTPQDANFYKKNFFDCFDKVYSDNLKIDLQYNKYHVKYKNPENIALEIEKKYKISIYKLFFTHRVIGRGFFASGGVRHPRNRTHYMSEHRELLNMAINYIFFWETLFKTEKVSLALNLEPVAHQLAIKNKIKAFRLFEGKFKNTFSWIPNTRLEPLVKLKDLENVKRNSKKKIKLNSPYLPYVHARFVDIEKLKFLNVIKKMCFLTLQIINGKIRGYQKSKNQFIYDEVASVWRTRTSYLEYLNKVNTNLKMLKGKKFVFFPLLTEPEIALHGNASDFFFQLSAINLISRDLPSDYLLVVKEHIIAFGRRPRDFYTQINDLGNVVFASPTDLGLEYIKKSKAVACITGTSALEALVMGIPVISFSKYNTWNFLKHVYFVDKIEDLSSIFLSINKENYPNRKSMEQGANFYKAYLDKYFEIADYNSLIPLASNVKKMPKFMHKIAEKFYKGLLIKLQQK